MRLILICLLLVYGCKNSSRGTSQTTSAVTSVEELALQDLINNYRDNLGLSRLIFDMSMNEISLAHSTAMANGTTAFGHNGFPARCDEARSALGGGNLCAENVAQGQTTPNTVFNSWLNSPGHKANIEQERFTHSGLSFKVSADGTYYWTQLFLEK